MKLSTFCLIKNEMRFIAYHVLSFLDHVDEMVFFDGNSTDGTVEALTYLQAEHPKGRRIRLFTGKDCTDLCGDYVRLFNEALAQCQSEYIAFIHPDMIPVNPAVLRCARGWDALVYSAGLRSFSHDMHTEITKGRRGWWKAWHKNTMGLHYHGFYGVNEEDMYYRDITGNNYAVLPEPGYYPYEIKDSGLVLNHYCEVKDYNRRLDKMVKSIRNQGYGLAESAILEMAKAHPRVTLKSGDSPFGVFEYKRCLDPLPAIFQSSKALSIVKKFTKEPIACQS